MSAIRPAVARSPLCRPRQARPVGKAVLVMRGRADHVRTDANPDGVPMEVFDMVREQTATNRAQFYHDFPPLPSRLQSRGAAVKEAVRLNWWRQG